MRTPAAVVLGLLFCACAVRAQAEPVADFYKGRTVTVVVSSSAAGGYDTIARVVARHIGRQMPGNPAFIVRNMPGAGGMTATNFLYNNAERDGTVIGLVQNNTPFEPLLDTREARYEPVKFNWLGTPSFETAMVLLWHAVPVSSIEELRIREVAVGVSGANSTPAFFARLLNATLGTRLKAVNGYPGQNEVLLAMERRELDGHPSAFFNSVRATRPSWLRDKTAKAIVQYGPEKIAELADVPFAPDLVAGEDKLVLQAAFAPLALGRPFLASRRSAWPPCAGHSRPPWLMPISWRKAKDWVSGSMRRAAASKSRT